MNWLVFLLLVPGVVLLLATIIAATQEPLVAVIPGVLAIGWLYGFFLLVGAVQI